VVWRVFAAQEFPVEMQQWCIWFVGWFTLSFFRRPATGLMENME